MAFGMLHDEYSTRVALVRDRLLQHYYFFYENKFFSGMNCFQNIFFLAMSQTEKKIIKFADSVSVV